MPICGEKEWHVGGVKRQGGRPGRQESAHRLRARSCSLSADVRHPQMGQSVSNAPNAPARHHDRAAATAAAACVCCGGSGARVRSAVHVRVRIRVRIRVSVHENERVRRSRERCGEQTIGMSSGAEKSQPHGVTIHHRYEKTLARTCVEVSGARLASHHRRAFVREEDHRQPPPPHPPRGAERAAHENFTLRRVRLSRRLCRREVCAAAGRRAPPVCGCLNCIPRLCQAVQRCCGGAPSS